ncbi:fluoride efflux transporter CrcB [Aliiroseovarius sp. F47248L]|uniref:fluoride efflux transporter CrcB n=1 Tax=Aliiroseovarius sp. F47248L TaxID=2926420 RepID=UPI001FF457DD|nr:fluoride efflux transporter CrcB [Aliiroseovarius sp. F47248L]MCK0137508.1 fluoride efflux transporter CrcB [Aliiroseovarius sp. F47248L]
MMTPLLQVALGGAIGASARYLTGNAVTRWLGHGFPAGTMVVNILGSFLMGLLVVTLTRKGGQAVAPFLMTGLLGGFTTFSAFSLDVITLYERGQIAAASGYVFGSVILSLAGLVAGLQVARMVLA